MTCGRATSTEPDANAAVRHFTTTGFVVWQQKVLIHWHAQERLWLPLGGHVETNEDPVQCVLREVLEESGIPVEIFGAGPAFAFTYPRQLAPPITILVEEIKSGVQPHEHVDFIYFCRPVVGWQPAALPMPHMRWLDRGAFETNVAVSPGPGVQPTAVPEDVRVLALEALRLDALDPGVTVIDPSR